MPFLLMSYPGHDDPGPDSWRWVSASGDHHAKHIYGAEDWQQKCHCSGEKQHSLPPNSQEENSSGMSCSCNHCVRATSSDPVVGGRGGTHTSQSPRLTVRQRQGRLLEELDFSGLASWPPELADSTQSLLMKYHDVFSLEPGKLGCTQSNKHVFKVTDDTPFKEWFRQIPPPLVEDVHNHLWEMLDLGTIWPSQSAWCNAVVLVKKKDGGLCFCIDFCHLNAHRKDSYPCWEFRRH